MQQNEKFNEKKVLVIGLILILAVAAITFFRPLLKKEKAAINNSPEENNIQYPAISFKELQDKIRNKENVKIIDIRGSDFFLTEHIIDSVNIPAEELEASNTDFDQSALVVIASSSGVASEVQPAAKILAGKGFNNLAVLSGGIAGWKNNYGPLVSSGDPQSFTDQAKVTFISAEDAKKILDEKRPVYFLDVRAAKDFSPHIPGASNIALDQLEKKRGEIPIGEEIIVYGATELEGFQAGVRLHDLDILSALVLRGGFLSWNEKGFPAQ